MIYKKVANFPYPILSEDHDYYIDNSFKLDVQINEDTEHFYFNFTYELDSNFIKNLLKSEKAQLILIIQSKDSKFYRLGLHDNRVKIPKNRLSLNNRVEVQLHIQAKENISFKNNDDINYFYQQYRDQIIVTRHSLLGYSNVVTFNGHMKKPFELFEKLYDENLTSAIKIELGTESIIIHYRDKDVLFEGMPGATSLNNTYIYIGLSRALHQFIINNDKDKNEEVEIANLDEPENLLDVKLLSLMKEKQVDMLNTENIDEVIYQISDRVIERLVTSVRRLEVSES